MTDPTKSVLDLTTDVSTPTPFTVDGEPYNMFTYEHLSKEQEAHAQALFRRHSRELNKLNTATNDQSAERAADSNHETRVDILCALTDMPREVASTLPTPQQARLMKEISSRMRNEAEEASDE